MTNHGGSSVVNVFVYLAHAPALVLLLKLILQDNPKRSIFLKDLVFLVFPLLLSMTVLTDHIYWSLPCLVAADIVLLTASIRNRNPTNTASILNTTAVTSTCGVSSLSLPSSSLSSGGVASPNPSASNNNSSSSSSSSNSCSSFPLEKLSEQPYHKKSYLTIFRGKFYYNSPPPPPTLFPRVAFYLHTYTHFPLLIR